MYRCPNPECRAMTNIHVRKLGYKQYTLGSKVYTSDAEPDAKYDHYTCTCHVCGTKNKIKVFKDAYNEPMKHFETDNLCVCGGEIWNDIEIKKLEVESDGNFDGDQRRVPMLVKTILRCDRCKKEEEQKPD